jgi:DNA-binding GntR family transcriptional regulator
MTTASGISSRIVEAVMAKKLLPGSRLGEQQLAVLFDCSRTVVREALTQLATRGIVTVTARRGWYLVELSQNEAHEAFEARLVLETGLIRRRKSITSDALQRLRAHIGRQQAAIESGDVGLRSFLLGDFHVCLAECLGNSVLADTLRDFTARTTLIAMRHQSERDAARSCAEHAAIVQAIESGDLVLAEQLLELHLSTWQTKLPLPLEDDPLAQLRQALLPVISVTGLHTTEVAI